MRTIKLVLGIIVSATILHFFSNFYFANSKQHQAAEAFVRKSPQVFAAIGSVISLDLRRYVSVAASENAGAYRLYDYMVSGNKGRANVVIRATPKGQPPTYHFSVESLDR